MKGGKTLPPDPSPAELLYRLQRLLESARQFESQLPRIRELDEQRQQSVPREGTREEWDRWEALNEPIESFYRDWRALAGEILPTLKACRALLPEREVERWLSKVGRGYVEPAVEALEEAIARLAQFPPPAAAATPAFATPEQLRQAIMEFSHRNGCRRADIYRSAMVDKSDFYKCLNGKIPRESTMWKRLVEVLDGRRSLKRQR